MNERKFISLNLNYRFKMLGLIQYWQKKDNSCKPILLGSRKCLRNYTRSFQKSKSEENKKDFCRGFLKILFINTNLNKVFIF